MSLRPRTNLDEKSMSAPPADVCRSVGLHGLKGAKAGHNFTRKDVAKINLHKVREKKEKSHMISGKRRKLRRMTVTIMRLTFPKQKPLTG